MSQEGQLVDKKSLRAVTGRNADWDGLAKDCVAFANAQGGRLLIGIEDDATLPAPSQRIELSLVDVIRRKIGERTVNVSALPEIRHAENGGEYIELHVRRSLAVASTTDGRYFLRIADESKPVVGDDVMRLAAERSALPWETQTTLRVPRESVDRAKLDALVAGIRASDRVKPSVKEKTDAELLSHYLLAHGEWLTNLGVLCVGAQADRARLGTAPVIQFIKYDSQERKVNKLVWDDHTLSPMELVGHVWREVPDFREFYEIPDGLFRQNVPVFDEVVVRELLINALVHRPYTQRGDIFISLHPERLEVVNPGPLPLGVTPENVLHESRRRNEHLTRLFHDLKLMEREGTGFDTLYEVLLSQGRPVPRVAEGTDWVKVTVARAAPKPHSIDFIAKASQAYPLTQRERIALGLLVQHEAMTAKELGRQLELDDAESLRPWIARLLDWGLVRQTGRTQATRYFVDPGLVRRLEFPAATSLKRIEPHRLRALIVEDLERYPDSAIGEIHRRIGAEIPRSQVKRVLEMLAADGTVQHQGEKRWRRYRVAA